MSDGMNDSCEAHRGMALDANHPKDPLDVMLAEVMGLVYAALLSRGENADLSKWKSFDELERLARLGAAVEAMPEECGLHHLIGNTWDAGALLPYEAGLDSDTYSRTAQEALDNEQRQEAGSLQATQEAKPLPQG